MLRSIYNSIKESGFLILFFFITLSLNHSFGYLTLIALFSIMCFFMITIKKRTINKQEALIILFLITYALFSSLNNHTYKSSSVILYFIAPFFFYQFGEYVAHRYKSNNAFVLFWFIVVLLYSFDTFYFSIESIISSGQIIGTDINNRTLEFESAGKSFSMSATNVGLAMDIAMVGLPMLFIENNNKRRLAFAILFLLGLATTLHMINRTGLIIAVLCLLTIIAYRYKKNIFALLFSIFLIFVTLYSLISFEIIDNDIISVYTERNDDLSTAGNRTIRWSEAIIQLPLNPFGWSDGKAYYIHNMWLDIARIAGLIPFIILVYFSLKSFKDSFTLINKNQNSLSYLLLGLNVCFFMSCFVEPIVAGTHLLLYFMLWGFTSQIKRINLKNKVTTNS